MQHLHDIMALQINNFNSFYSSCNNLPGLTRWDNILRMIVASKPHLPYIWYNKLQHGSGHIIDHLNLELLLYIDVLGYVKGTLRGALFS